MNIAHRRSLVVLAAAAACLSAIDTAHASRLFFSSSATSPTEKNTLSNASLRVTQGQTVSLYLWYERTGSQRFSGLGHDIVSSNPIVEKVSPNNGLSYFVDNPSIDDEARWNSVNTGAGSATFLIDDANLVKIAGSSLGAGGAADPTFDSATNSYRVGRVDLRGTTLGTTEIRLGVGFGGIAFSGLPSSTTINFGFGDDPIAGDDNRRSTSTAVSTLADALIQVVSAWQNPEDRFDVNQSGEVTPLDALVVINELNDNGPSTLPLPTAGFGPPPFFDVSGNGSIEPLDALQVIDSIDPTGSLAMAFRMSSVEMAVPEPASAWLMGIGALALGALKYRARRAGRQQAARRS